MQTTLSLPIPPMFDNNYWPKHLFGGKAPQTYRGTKFDFWVVNEFIQADDEQSTVTIMGKTVKAGNLQLETLGEAPNYPMYFELTGKTYHYVFSVWQNRFVVDVHDLGVLNAGLSDTLRSTEFPATSEELQRALTDIASDLA